MSAENVEIARDAFYEAFRRGDLEGVGTYFADDVVWETPDTLPNRRCDPRPRRGPRELLGTFEVLEQVQCGPRRVHRRRRPRGGPRR